LKVARRGGLLALLLLVLAIALAGCMPRGAMSNPGWTVVSATPDVVFGALATGQVVALKAATGEAIWIYPVPQQSSGGLFARRSTDSTQGTLDAVYGLPALTDELVLVASYNKQLYAFDRATGRQAWDVPFAAEGALVGGVTVEGDRVYVGSSDYRVYALDLKTGEPVWEKPFETENWVWGAPAVDEDHVYVGSMDHHVYAINRDDGTLAWEQDIGGSVPGNVVLGDGMLFVGGVDKQLHALRAQDGTQLWARPLGHWVWGEALVQDGYVYVGSLDGRVHALRISDGAPRWESVALGGTLRAGPVLLGDQLIVGTDSGNIYRVALDSGHSTLLFKAPAAVLSRPAVVGNRVYIGTTMSEVLALDASGASASQLWVYPAKK
jgi:outer membrane protein assembly factor BamB